MAFGNSPRLQEPLVIAASARLPYILLGAVVILYGALILYLPFHSPPDIYNSPDEMANAFFIRSVEQDGRLIRPTIQQNLPSVVFPRGVLRQDNAFIPVGFVSFPLLLGIIAKLTSFKGLFYLMAILSALSLLAWYGFLHAFFGARLALLTTFLTAGHPLVLYWSNRPLLPNALFFAFYFFAFYFFSRTFYRPDAGSSRNFYSILAGLVFGLAVAIRPQEGVWLAAVVLLVAVLFQSRSWYPWMIFLITAALPVGGLLAAQKIIYGSASRTGYHLTPPSLTILQTLRRVVLPFGLNIKAIGAVSYSYWIDIIWCFTILSILGLAIVLMYRNGTLLRRLRFWALVLFIVSAWLMVFYGSFAVQDRFDRTVSLGTSFTRYFLPIYVMALPFVAYALFFLRRRFGKILVSAVVVVTVFLSMRAIFWGGDEGFIRIVKALNDNKEVRAKALQILPANAVILTDRSDKIFFPEREIVSQFRKFHHPDFEKLYGLNLYYETIADTDVVAFENDNFWGPHRLKAQDPVDLGYRHKLYKLEELGSRK